MATTTTISGLPNQLEINSNISPTKLVITKQPIKLRESTESPFKSMMNTLKNTTISSTIPEGFVISNEDTSSTITTPSEESSLSSSSGEESSSISDNESKIHDIGNTLRPSNSSQDFTPLCNGKQETEIVKISNSTNLSNFIIKHLVGKGGFGKVFQVSHVETQKVYALKVIKKNHIIARKSVVNTLAEKDILKKISHPFIVNLHYAFQNEKKLYLVMDFINGGQLFYHLQKEAIFSEDQVRFYMAELILALEHLHASDIVHRDLKPENILLDSQGHCILTDFGLAKLEVKTNNETFSFAGTLEYMAPELIQHSTCGKAVDWWSIGILMYDMMIGKPPFEHKNRALMQEKIISEKPKFPKFVSSSARSLINGLLTKDPTRRLGTKGAIEIKQHPFFKSIQWRKIENKEITPPFIPSTKGVDDISNFDHASLKAHQRDSFSTSPTLSSSQQAYFDGFSFVRTPVLFEPPK
ncbi:hypothetical protein RB653_003166 [Dictyostelium firmibasis]|uniref:non-specific serine/threonine protein kinase n=1 Tax=Dictyostelium firmibasis TaxID=79012 RepID=A0AAN7TZ60_9MYCE